jgi:Fur family peroxide stress response transcriptional regulator
MSGEPRPTGMQDVEGKMAAFRTRCRQAGLKVTPQRMTVYRTLLTSTEHPSAEMVFREVRRLFSSISLDTVNRTLLTLNEIGAAFIVEGSGDAKRFDANLQVHQHFKCVNCKRIIDFRHEPFDKIDVPKDLRDRFTVLRKTVYLEGFCDRCQKRA